MSVTVAKRTLLLVALLVVVVAAANAWLLFGSGQIGIVAVVPPTSPPSASSGAEASDDVESSLGTVWAIGDSLMVGATDLLEERVPGIEIDAQRGQTFERGIDVLASGLDDVEPDTIVLALGTNNGVSPEQISRAMDLAAGVDRVIFVNVVVPRQWETETNVVILRAVIEYPTATFVDWYTEAAGEQSLFRSDGFHLSATGNTLWVDLIAAEVLR